MKEIFDVKWERISNLVSALLCAATGMLFISIGLKHPLIGSYEIIPFFMQVLVYEPLTLAGLGIGFVFLVSAIFFIRNAFEGDFFLTGSHDWPTGSKFCVFLLILWIIMYGFYRLL